MMIDRLSPEMHKNDSIIIIEYFRDVPSAAYLFTIYESRLKTVKRFAHESRYNVPSIYYERPYAPDYILKMVLNNQLGQIKSRGDSSFTTSSTQLIVNILVKNKNKFTIKTLKTKNFDAGPRYSFPEPIQREMQKRFEERQKRMKALETKDGFNE